MPAPVCIRFWACVNGLPLEVTVDVGEVVWSAAVAPAVASVVPPSSKRLTLIMPPDEASRDPILLAVSLAAYQSEDKPATRWPGYDAPL